MFTTFRAKLTAIVGIAAFAFVILIVVSAAIAGRVGSQLGDIQGRYLPRLELGPQLDSEFELLKRSLQDAVGARDGDALESTRTQYDALIHHLAAGQQVLEGSEASALRDALQEYFEEAYDVSRRMIEGETGEGLVEAISVMQTKQNRAAVLLKKTTAFDRGELTRAFEGASQALIGAGQVRLGVGVACLSVVILLSFWLSRSVLASIRELSLGLERFGQGEFQRSIPVRGNDELAQVARRANVMAQNLERLKDERDSDDWLKAGHAGLSRELRGELTPQEVGARAVRYLARYLEAPVGALYYADGSRVLRLLGEYGLSPMDDELAAALSFRIGEGLVGQACLQDELTVIPEPPPNYLKVRTGSGESTPSALVFLPIVHLGKVTGVLELGLFKPWSETLAELLMSVRETLAIAIEVAGARATLGAMLAESQRQAQLLTAQEEELQATNEELHTQQEELRQTNEELTQQALELEAQRQALQVKNGELDQAGQELKNQAEELTRVSSYKSQFLANMSHELRTPLNSMLLLSSLLADNDAGNLTSKQVEFSRTIHSAGKDLLALINQVLDLAKVESGKQQLRVETVAFNQLTDHAERVFRPLASDKGLDFKVELDPELPATIETDRQRVQQVLNNLLGNAIKFTQRGRVTLQIRRAGPGQSFQRPDLLADRAFSIAVTDTGVGIAPEHQERVFVPFEQVEAASDRRFGGTGLGLTIARELAQLLGGTLELSSVPGQGSTFTCHLPYQAPASPAEPARPPVLHHAPAVRPVQPSGEAYLLVVEDDPVFAEAFVEMIQKQGLPCERVADGKSALELCRRRPPHGILLDVELPDLNGWQVMEQLRLDPVTASIPVHFVSAGDGAQRALAMGAVGYLTKPATRQQLALAVDALAPGSNEHARRILVVEQDTASSDSLVRELLAERLLVTRVVSAKGALLALQKERFVCVILDLSLPDMDGLEFLRSLREQSGPNAPSIIVYTARPLSKPEAKSLEAYAETVVLKEGSSSERLLDEVRLFVRRLKAGIAPRRLGAAPGLPPHVHLGGKKVLVVDDDMRTVYALSATLRAKGAEVLVADTGKAALSVLQLETDVDAVLMDIMMPEMDGYETMRRIRQELQLLSLPIIALTAKAMKGDRERCIEVGASDYLPKPVDPERLLAMLHASLNGGSTEKVNDA
jgi:CheY-like chemotaxis protein/signal transduction histidine kinase